MRTDNFLTNILKYEALKQNTVFVYNTAEQKKQHWID